VSSDDTPRRREVAYRLFAAEFDDADVSYAESDEERAPNYVVTPTGARLNRTFAVGVLTAVEQAGEEILRARVADPTGAFVVYAGQYQPDAQTFFERVEPPGFLAVAGKARTFQPEDSDVVYASLRPESVNEVDAPTRDRWTIQTAEQTLHRVRVMAAALRADERGDSLRKRLDAAGVDESLAAGVPLAIDHYGTTGAYLTAVRDLALDAARVVAGEIEAVDSLSVDPGVGGEGELAALAADGPDLDDGGETDPLEAREPTTAGATADGSAVGTASGSTASSTDDPDADDPDADEAGDPETDTSTSTVEESPASTADEETTGVDDLLAADEALGETTTVEKDVSEFDPGEFELDEQEREEIESEFGTEFQSGTDVDDPGEADIETPAVDDPGEADIETPAVDDLAGGEDASDVDEPAGIDESSGRSATDGVDAGSTGSGQEDAPAEEDEAAEETPDEVPPSGVDLQDAVMETMETLDEGDGADREALIESVVETHGADREAVDEAIQDALMDGRCYESSDGRLKRI